VIGEEALLPASPQFRILGFRFFQDGNVGVGVFPERQEILVGGKRSRPRRWQTLANLAGVVPGVPNRPNAS
jgi:hypothetical protein